MNIFQKLLPSQLSKVFILSLLFINTSFAETLTVTTNKSTISVGSAAEISFTRPAADAICTISGGIFNASLLNSGESKITVTPKETTRYDISCMVANTSHTGNVTVTVLSPRVTITPKVSNVNSGTKVTFKVETTNVTRCLLTGGKYYRSAITKNGNVSDKVKKNTIYYFNCLGQDNVGIFETAVVNVKGDNSSDLSLVPISRTIDEGESIKLIANGINVRECITTGGVYNRTFTSSNRTFNVRPTKDTTYKMSCKTDAGKTLTVESKIKVTPSTRPSSAPRLSVEPEVASILKGQSLTLEIDKKNVNLCTITGGQFENSLVTINSLQVQPTTTTTYTISCTTKTTPIVKTSVVTVDDTGTLQLNISADKQTITNGEIAKIKVSSFNVNTCKISGGEITGDADVTANGEKEVRPTADATYKVKCIKADKSIEKTVSVSVKPVSGAMTLSVTPATSSVILGDSETFTITRTNANTCTISGLEFKNTLIPATSNTFEIKPARSGNYLVKCSNSYQTKEATVSIEVLTSGVTITPASANIKLGSSVNLDVKTSGNISDCHINGGTYIRSLFFGNKKFTDSPKTKTSYVVNCKNEFNQRVYATSTITVVDGALPTLSVSPSTKTVKPGEQVKITLNAKNISRCFVTGGSYFNTQVSNSLEINVKPTTTTTYNFRCVGEDSSTVRDEAVITVSEVDNIATPTLKVSPAVQNIFNGASTTISVESKGADNCLINGGEYINSIINQKNVSVKPTTTTTYTVTCNKATKSISTTTLVNVAGDATVDTTKVLKLVVSPVLRTVDKGADVTINITKENATACTLTGGAYNNSSYNENTITFKADKNVVYKIVCNGFGQTKTVESTINVREPKVTVTPAKITAKSGQEISFKYTSQNARFCSVNGGKYRNSDLGLNRTEVKDTVTKSTTYTVTCINRNEVKSTAKVEVTVK